MFRKETKAFSAFYLLLLIVILFSFSINFGASVFIIDALVAAVTSVLLLDDIKKYQANVLSRFFIVIALNFILYILPLLSLSLSNMKVGDGYGKIPVLFLYIIISGISVIIGWIKIFSSHTKVPGGKLNLYIYLVAIFLLILASYNFLINKLAFTANNPSLCSAAIRVRDSSLLFSNDMENLCLTDLGVKLDNPEFCKTESCLAKIAFENSNLSVCNKAEAGSNCVYDALFYITTPVLSGDKTSIPEGMSPAYCDVLTDKSKKDQCLISLALAFEDAKYCLEVDDFDNCYARLADVQRNDDTSQCDILLSEEAKENCLRYIRSTWVTAP